MSAVTSKDGTTIAYERSGAGRPVILVDGALCHRDSGPARKVAAELSDEFAVITYDRRGRGGSGDAQPYSVEREIEDIEALIEAAGDRALPSSEHVVLEGQSHMVKAKALAPTLKGLLDPGQSGRRLPRA